MDGDVPVSNHSLKLAHLIALETFKKWKITYSDAIITATKKDFEVHIGLNPKHPNCYTVVMREPAQRVSEGYWVQEGRRYSPVPSSALRGLLDLLQELS